jgi:TRAP-type uncharacterized transport system fused permease subunit
LITPPDCLPVYIAASIARANFWQTGWTAMRLGIAAYIVPFIFALHPALIFMGSAQEIVSAVVTASVGVVLLGAACAGYIFRPLGWGKRIILLLAGLLLLLPNWSGVWLIADAAGFVLGFSLILWEWNKSAVREIPVAQPNSGG